MKSRIKHEMTHGKMIIDDADLFWGWSTYAGRKRLQRRVALLSKYADLKPGRIALELGCGKGFYTRELVKTGAKIVPIDISIDLLFAARGNTGDITFLQTDAHRLPFADKSFDAVVGVSVLHHLDIEMILSESVRVLRPGGKFVFSEPNMMNPQIFIQKNMTLVKRLLGDSPDETAFYRWSLCRQMAKAGLRVLYIKPFDFLHPWISRLLVGYIDAAGQYFEKIPLIREIAGSLLIIAER